MLSTLQWARDPKLVNIFEMDYKTIVDSIYGNMRVSDYTTIIKDYGRLLVSDLTNSDVKFIKSQGNKVAHSLAREAPYHAC